MHQASAKLSTREALSVIHAHFPRHHTLPEWVTFLSGSLGSRSGKQNGKMFAGREYLALCLPKIFSVLKLQDSQRRGAREGRTGGGTAKFDLTFNFFLLIWQKPQPATESYYFAWVPVSQKHLKTECKVLMLPKPVSRRLQVKEVA